MKIAFVTPVISKHDSGAKIHTFNTLKNLISEGHDIYFYGCSKEKLLNIKNTVNIAGLKKTSIIFNGNLDSYCKNFGKIYLFIQSIFSMTPFTSSKFFSSKLIRTILRDDKKYHFDSIFIDHIYIANYKDYLNNPNLILQSHLLPSILFKGMFIKDSSLFKKVFGLSEFIKYFFFERKYLKKYKTIYSISQSDKNNILKIVGKNSRVLEKFPRVVLNPLVNKSQKINSNYVVFTGNLNWYPNYDGINWFIRNIYPHVSKIVPDFKLIVIGEGKEKFSKLKNRHILFTGYINDLRSYYNNAKLFIVPVRYGSGVKTKIIKALNFGLPVLTTKEGLEGLEIPKKAEIYIANNEIQFIKKLVNLMQKKGKKSI